MKNRIAVWCVVLVFSAGGMALRVSAQDWAHGPDPRAVDAARKTMEQARAAVDEARKELQDAQEKAQDAGGEAAQAKISQMQKAVESAELKAEAAQKEFEAEVATEGFAYGSRIKAYEKRHPVTPYDPAPMSRWMNELLLNSKGDSQNCHFVAVVRVRTKESGEVREFRYETFPGLQRVVAPDGASYVRRGDNGWGASRDWGKTSAPITQQAGAEIGAMAELALRPLTGFMDRPQGSWKLLDVRPGDRPAFRFVGDGSKPDADCPVFFFSGDVPLSYVHAQEWSYGGKLSEVTVWYFCDRDATKPPAAPGRAEQLAAALRATTAAGPVKVDAVIRAGERWVRVAGIISGSDYDLTTIVGGEESRMIAVDGDAWKMSRDGKASSKLKDKPDRAFFDAVHAPLDPAATGVEHWLYDTSDGRDLRDGAAPSALAPRYFARDPGAGMLFLPKLPPGGGDAAGLGKYWMAMKGDAPGALRGFDGEVVIHGDTTAPWLVHATYAPSLRGVKAPPAAGPGEAPVLRPEEMLQDALAAMEGGAWDVEKSIRTADAAGKLAEQGTVIAAGRYGGAGFDCTSVEGGVAVRVIHLGGKAWTSRDNGPWQEIAQAAGAACKFRTATELSGELETMPLYEIVGTEKHGAEAWLHISALTALGMGGRSTHFWLLLDNKTGKPVAVRRWAAPLSPGGGDSAIPCVVEDFTRVSAEAAITSPVAK